MEVTALCITLLMNVLFLPCVFHQKVDSVFLRVVPNKLQFFEYESLSLHCEGFSDSTGWKIAHQFKKETCRNTDEETSTETSCILKSAYRDDSGEYWCEDGEGRRSNSINITVTDGPVILESPALPLKGDNVTLSCRNKKTSSNITADFYKDGFVFSRSSTGNMNIYRVSKSNEGLYKCNISGVGESAESWLTVRESVFLRVISNKLHIFQSESVAFHCESFFGSTGWKVVHQSKGELTWCRTTDRFTSADSSCTIKTVSPDDSGEFWCEDGEGRRSHSVSIIVSALHTETRPSSDLIFIIFRNIMPVVLMTLLLLLLLLGRLQRGNLRGSRS